MAPRTTRSSNKKSKKGNSVEEEDRIEVEIAPLSGILVTLPYETLVEILSLCTPQSLVRMLRTCKAIKGLVDAEERTFYRKLYHNLLYDFRGYRIQNHNLYSPMKQTVVTEYPHTQPLPLNAIFSWKDQYRMTALWINDLDLCCMKCLGTQNNCNLIRVEKIEMTLCPLCYSSSLVSPSNLSLYQITAKDVVGIPVIELETEAMVGGLKLGKYLFSSHLEALGRQKHGDKYTGPRIVEIDETDPKQLKEDTVMAACLIQGGRSYRDNLYFASKQVGLEKLGADLCLELANAGNGQSFKKTSGLKKRDLSLVLQDYVRLVKKITSTVPIVDQGDPYPFFLPAHNPGPLIPSDVSVVAYGKVREIFSTHFLSRFHLFDPRTPSKMAALQDYVLAPTDSKWKLIKQIVREEEIETRNQSLKTIVASNENKSWLNMEGIISAMESAEGGEKLTVKQVKRISFLAQCSAIIGEDSLNSENAAKMLLYHTAPEKIPPGIRWMLQYYYNGITSPTLLAKVYTVSKSEWSSNLILYAKTFIGVDNIGTDVTSSYIGELLPSFAKGNNQRVNNYLTRRYPINRELYEKEIKNVMSLQKSGILTTSNVIAVLRAQGVCDCLNPDNENIHCFGSCWIDYVGYGDDEDY